MIAQNSFVGGVISGNMLPVFNVGSLSLHGDTSGGEVVVKTPAGFYSGANAAPIAPNQEFPEFKTVVAQAPNAAQLFGAPSPTVCKFCQFMESPAGIVLAILFVGGILFAVSRAA